MSLILDALKKADNERREDDQGPSIGSQHAEYEQAIENEDSPSSSKKPVIIAIALTSFFAALIITFLWPESHTVPAPSSKLPLAEPVAPMAVQLKKTDAKRMQTQNGSEIIESEPSEIRKQLIEAQYQEAQKAEQQKMMAQEIEAEKQANKQALASLDESEGSISTLYGAEENAAPVKDKIKPSTAPVTNLYKQEETAVVSTKNTDAPQQNNPNSLSAHTQVKLIKELSYAAQNDIPTLIYSRHDYIKPGSRDNSIVINGKTLKENNSFESGIVLEKILEDGILLRKGQDTFKMKARNSWLNY